MPLAVLDSSVLVPFWSRFALQRLAANEPPQFVAVWSEWIIAETWRVLAWRWIASGRNLTPANRQQLTHSANTMLRFLLPVMRMTSLHQYIGPDPWPSLHDPDDIPLWHTATSAGARYVVSHNTTDFPPLTDGHHAWRGVEFLTAIEFIEDVLGEDIASLVPGPITPAALIRSNRTRLHR